MQKLNLPLQACTLPRFMESSIGPRMEICINSGLPITMLPCFRQSNVYIKRKLRVWRARKCSPLVGAETEPTSMGLQTTLVHGGKYRGENGNLCIFGSTYRHGTVFAPKQYLYQKEAKDIDSPKMYSTRRCINHTCLYGPANYPSSWRAV